MAPKRLGGAREAAKQQSTASSHEREASPKRSRSPQRRTGGIRSALKAEARKEEKQSSIDEADTDEDVEALLAQNEYRDHLLNLWTKNKLSALDTQKEANFATRAGAKGVSDIANTGAGGKWKANIPRDILRKELSNNTLPSNYYAEVPCHDPDTGNNHVMMSIPFLLLHEMLYWLIMTTKRIAVSSVTEFPIGTPAAALHAKLCSSLNLGAENVIPLGIHGDGVPFGKNKSIEVFSWNFIAIPHLERILFCLIERRYLCQCGCHGRHTINGILSVFRYSLLALLENLWPTKRHDGSPWAKTDQRSKARGSFGFRALLQQSRGDWAWHKQIVGFAGWAGESICWLCKANKTTIPYTDFSLSALWRKHRHTTASMIHTLKQAGVQLSVLFACPGFEIIMIMIDHLHTLDLGFVSALVAP